MKEGGSLSGLESGFLSDTWKWSCLRRGVLSKREALLGRATGAEGRRVRETERTTLSRGSHSQVLWSSGSFLVCLLPVILNWDPSWGHTHHSAEMDSSEVEPGRLVGPLNCSRPSPFDLSRILVGGSLFVPCSFPGPPVVR